VILPMDSDDMRSISWWPILTLLVVAMVVDIHGNRIPNWLVLPFLVSGVIVSTAIEGVKGFGQSIGGMGAGCHGSLGKSPEGSSELVADFWTRGIRPHSSLVLDNPCARTMP